MSNETFGDLNNRFDGKGYTLAHVVYFLKVSYGITKSEAEYVAEKWESYKAKR